jgi:alcohol dehydrogenase class IV
MGATAFQKGLGAMHALSHPVGARLGTHHGETNAVVMPYVLVRNREAIADRLALLARALDLPTPGFEGVLEWVLELRERLGVPSTLADLGMTEGQVDELAPMAAADPAGGGNPVSLDAAGYAELYRDALRGALRV